MPSIDTVDSIEINAPAQELFDIVLDYPRMHEWYPRYRVEVIGGGDVVAGARLRHVLSPKGSPSCAKSRPTRNANDSGGLEAGMVVAFGLPLASGRAK